MDLKGTQHNHIFPSPPSSPIILTPVYLPERSRLFTTHNRSEAARTTAYPTNGFGGLTSRFGKKPIISAVNGHAHGAGFEIALNSDIVLASPNATFRLPDVMRGTAALTGAFPRMCASFGM